MLYPSQQQERRLVCTNLMAQCLSIGLSDASKLNTNRLLRNCRKPPHVSQLEDPKPAKTTITKRTLVLLLD